MVAALILTAISIMANITISKARAAKAPPDAELMRKLGLAGLSFAVLTLILAVLAFT